MKQNDTGGQQEEIKKENLYYQNFVSFQPIELQTIHSFTKYIHKIHLIFWRLGGLHAAAPTGDRSLSLCLSFVTELNCVPISVWSPTAEIHRASQ